MRFRVHVDNNWQVTITCSAKPADWLPPRNMRKLSDERRGLFPLPPEDEVPAPIDPHHALCKGDLPALWTAYQNIVNRRPEPGGVEQFGRYLFDTLIGKASWEAMLQAAAENDAQSIELALSWSQSDGNLHRLNWELMHGPDGFLAAGRPRPVAFTRLVAGTQHMARQVSLPPRVLFVIGASATDPAIRPGAEYLGLLRQIRRNERAIHSRVLERASPSQIRRAIASFRPDTVHFICHGYFDPQEGRGYLELELDEKDTDRRRSGAQILEYLNLDGQYPPIVVLSACYSGAMLGVHQTAPLVAELVAGGVPIVIGMAGRVSDLACRLFTRRFGEALVEGTPIVEATAEGRRAAFAEGVPPHRSVDWAFPALFMSEQVGPAYRPTPADSSSSDPSLQLERRVKTYGIGYEPVFCGRQRFLDAYYALFEPGRPTVVAPFVREALPGYGRTRLLHELTAQAVRDGHVPCLVSSESPNWSIPTNATQLGLAILSAVARARTAFDLKPPVDSRLLKLLTIEKPPANLDTLLDVLRDEPDLLFARLLQQFDGVDDILGVDAVRVALQKDLIQLISDVREKHGAGEHGKRHALVLLDEVDQYGEALTSALFGTLLGPFGFGTADETIPIILTFALGTAADEILRPIAEHRSAKSWLHPIELSPFQEGEDMLAYEQVLLHPFMPDFLPGTSDVPLAVNEQASDKTIDLWRGLFRDFLKGMPSSFRDGTIYVLAKNAVKGEYLIDANDEIILKKMRGQLP